MIALKAALSFAWRNWKLIAGGLALATLGLLLMLAKGDARGWEKQATQNRALYDRETMAHSMTRASLNRLQTALDDQSLAVKQLAAESDARTLATTDARKAAGVNAAAAEKRAAALDASAAAPRTGEPCAPSDVFWNLSRKDL